MFDAPAIRGFEWSSLFSVMNSGWLAGLLPKSLKPPRLVSLCVAVIGKHLEDIVEDLGDIAVNFPPDVKVGSHDITLLILAEFICMFIEEGNLIIVVCSLLVLSKA